MGIKTVTIIKAKCERCGKEWQPRKPIAEVEICPRCKSAYWDKPRS